MQFREILTVTSLKYSVEVLEEIWKVKKNTYFCAFCMICSYISGHRLVGGGQKTTSAVVPEVLSSHCVSFSFACFVFIFWSQSILLSWNTPSMLD